MLTAKEVSTPALPGNALAISAFLLGEMWQSFYKTPLLNLFYGEEEYEQYLRFINRDSGEWIGHEMDLG
ncbi:hypothetical protein [Serratia plymuthica]|uniref:Uncharacterized protein n=1 Tax=Serratia plymuthica TaxID=82996 RepID=A0A2X4UTQ9_SERPL|nr:hypothetical protein [Serratia plymuthica]QPS23446.1 hypothetical protein I6G64_23135 [Serratia plymuthica]QPS58548.1 hypothetical protein I6G53_11115 [Serratia plymuthica]QPS65709.1 hypothetical protein I6G52_18395 [Serratia plymuthica]RKS65702.1 hypothetical protein C8E17_5077 [Serratia plymuthica]UNK30756.1 hypothetical protein MNO11_10785 [Serratia plymuthica]